MRTTSLVIGIPAAALETVRARLPDVVLFAWTHSPFVEALRPHLPAGFLPVELSSGVGAFSLFRRTSRPGTTQDRLRRRAKRQGWSAAKTERAVGQASKGDFSKSFVGLRPSVREFLAELAREHGRFYLLLYSVDELAKIPAISPTAVTTTSSSLIDDSSIVRDGVLLIVEPPQPSTGADCDRTG